MSDNSKHVISTGISKPESISSTKDSQTDTHKVQEFKYNRVYYGIPGAPSPHDALIDAGFSENEIEVAWIAFQKYAEKCVTTTCLTFTEKCNHTYNVKNGFVALGTERSIMVLNKESIDIDKLLDDGFKLDSTLVVPFSEHEAYYDKVDDCLITWY